MAPTRCSAPTTTPLRSPSPPLASPSQAQAFADRTKKSALQPEPLASGVAQFYQTDAISRASKVMARCIKAREQPVPSM